MAQRYTFIVQVHPEGVVTLENLGTRERVQVLELASVGTQIEGWLQTPTAAGHPGPGEPAEEPADEERG